MLKLCQVENYKKALLARALAQEAKILLLDEPTSALDLNNAVEFMKILKNISIKKEIICDYYYS